jgi:membrane protease YdiL (CAAX protease family)
MPVLIDHLLVALVLVAAPIDGAFERRRLEREIAAGKPDAKLEAYARIIKWQWGSAVVLIAYWLFSRRPLSDLGFSVPQGAGFLFGALIVAAFTFLFVRQIRAVRQNPEFAAQARQAAASLSFMTPTTAPELQRFSWLGITAGIVEELICRGFLIWYFSSFMPMWAAILVTAMVFGLGHLYQGFAGILKTGVVGLLFGWLYWISGSIWLPMFLHAATDVLQGQMIYFAASESRSADTIGE